MNKQTTKDKTLHPNLQILYYLPPNQARIVRSTKILERKPLKIPKGQKFRRNNVNQHIGYISPKNVKNDISTSISSSLSSPLSSQFTSSFIDYVMIDRNLNTTQKRIDLCTLQKSQNIGQFNHKKKCKNQSAQEQLDLQKQNGKNITNKFFFIDSLKQEVTMLKRQNERLISSYERMQTGKQKIMIENQKMKKIIQEQACKLEKILNMNLNLYSQLSQLKAQTSLKDSRIIELQEQIKAQSTKNTINQGQFEQITIKDLRKQIFQMHHRLKYQQIQIITLNRAKAHLEIENKQMNKLISEKEKLEKRIEILIEKQNRIRQRNKYIENKDRHFVIQLSPEKQE